jgi:orotate phosphoribosyltransferase
LGVFSYLLIDSILPGGNDRMASNMGTNREYLAELYYRSNSVRFGAFRLSIHVDRPELPLSPYYLHYPEPGEPGSELLPELYEIAGQEFYDMCESQATPIRPKRIAGVPKGALPLADAHARQYQAYPNNLVTFTKLSEPNRTVFLGPVGEFYEGEELMIDEDHTSAGRNKRLIRAAAISAGLVVPNMLTIVDRQQGGVENMAREGVRLLSIFTVDEILRLGVELGQATQQQVDEVIEYRALNQY